MNNQKKQKRHFEHWQMVAIYLLVYDIVVIAASFFGALWFRFDCRFPADSPGVSGALSEIFTGLPGLLCRGILVPEAVPEHLAVRQLQRAAPCDHGDGDHPDLPYRGDEPDLRADAGLLLCVRHHPAVCVHAGHPVRLPVRPPAAGTQVGGGEKNSTPSG